MVSVYDYSSAYDRTTNLSNESLLEIFSNIIYKPWKKNELHLENDRCTEDTTDLAQIKMEYCFMNRMHIHGQQILEFYHPTEEEFYININVFSSIVYQIVHLLCRQTTRYPCRIFIGTFVPGNITMYIDYYTVEGFLTDKLPNISGKWGQSQPPNITPR